ncbi:Glutamate dehydrogenase NAD-dependent [Penicillium atrosanguineum]|uniref:Dienelactone hydrolase n=1 Tax=Penicillium atrosanguineum TaxID=1132637 RepID=A0A9W9U5I1_9EURO|nr:Glutamate dehydrogenase NAD-dependent [Penicillium atrosanguineum]KAJ5142132.1 hypothetical protein N7526_003127 [Penicillium atrosanguineum]KAJ5298727.1 Glutamate dehydrogenase NAD-dependent [Penicillium atrosanguineum]KAJ5321007.1 hypothetical protein N7476_004009 [Penicillium atrosanguineum]
MVNVFSRLVRRATSSGSAAADTGAKAPHAQTEHGPPLSRTLSASSAKRLRHAPADEAVPRYLLLISDSADFDPHILHRFQAEGFDVKSIGFVGSGDSERDRRALENAVHEKEDELEEGERYAIVAYSRPAYYLLGSHHLTSSNTNPFPRLCALIAYYPLTSTDQWSRDYHAGEAAGPACCTADSIFEPGPNTNYLPIQIHLPGHEVKPTFWPWIGISASEGDTTYKKRHRCYVYAYPGAKAGFAERDVEGRVDDGVNAQLAWSRVIGCLRRAFGIGSNWAVVDIETVWEEYWARIMVGLDDGKESKGQGEGPLELMVMKGQAHEGNMRGRMDMHEGEGPALVCVPSKAGGSNPKTLESFFAGTFIPNGPASQRIRLLSRTVGADQIVDEISFSFRHTAEIPWLLPSVAPTNRDIQTVIVVVACFCADKIVKQVLYWDQADVLVQAGLLDPKLVPKTNAVR